MTTASAETTIRVFQGTAEASGDGWANDAYYTLDRAGINTRMSNPLATSWEECNGRADGEEYVTMLVPAVFAEEALATLAANNFSATVDA